MLVLFFLTKHFLDQKKLDQHFCFHFFFNEKYLEEKNVTYSDPKFSRRLCSLHPRIQKTDSLKRIRELLKRIP